jgi:hypothetical protein
MKTQKYQILIQGLVDKSWTSYFAGMILTVKAPGVTSLSGELADQSALYGLLSKIRDLNIGLMSVQLLDSDGVTPSECRRCRLKKPAAGQNKNCNGTRTGRKK